MTTATTPDSHRSIRLPTFRGTPAVIIGFAMLALPFLLWLCGVRAWDIHDYVPKAEQLLRPGSATRTFIVGHPEVTGVYGNMDVNSDVCTYVTELSEQAFWDTIDDSAKEDEWKLIKDGDSRRRYLKVIPRTGQQVEHMVLEARVGFRASDTTAVIALLAVGKRGPVPPAFPKGIAAEFAEENVWPKFEALLEGL